MKQETDALTEIGKEIGKEAVKKASNFLEKLLIPSFEEIGLLA